MIQIGRQLLSGEFPGNSMELKLAGEIREKINSQSAELERDESKRELLIEFRILDDQVTTQVVPGHLAFWIMPEQGTLTKLDASVDEEVTVARGVVWAKILYVLLPNWQLFWLADAVSPEEEKLKMLRQDMKYREGHVPWSYVFTSLFYVVLYVGLVLSAALWLFENRELN